MNFDKSEKFDLWKSKGYNPAMMKLTQAKNMSCTRHLMSRTLDGEYAFKLSLKLFQTVEVVNTKNFLQTNSTELYKEIDWITDL